MKNRLAQILISFFKSFSKSNPKDNFIKTFQLKMMIYNKKFLKPGEYRMRKKTKVSENYFLEIKFLEKLLVEVEVQH